MPPVGTRIPGFGARQGLPTRIAPRFCSANPLLIVHRSSSGTGPHRQRHLVPRARLPASLRRLLGVRDRESRCVLCHLRDPAPAEKRSRPDGQLEGGSSVRALRVAVRPLAGAARGGLGRPRPGASHGPDASWRGVGPLPPSGLRRVRCVLPLARPHERARGAPGDATSIAQQRERAPPDDARRVDRAAQPSPAIQRAQHGGFSHRERSEAAQSTRSMRLSALYRGVLAATQRTHHSLADELALCQAYLDVEHARFGERLAVEIEIASGLLPRGAGGACAACSSRRSSRTP